MHIRPSFWARRRRIFSHATLSTRIPVGGEVIETQVTADLKRAFVVAEHHSQAELALGLQGSQAPLQEIAEVRLVGAELADVKATRRGANYLVGLCLKSQI
jgi:hypothetical protein